MRRFAFAAAALAVVATSCGGASRYGAAIEARGKGTTTSTSATTTTTPANIVNGVDQEQLRECIAARGNCMETVPGLQACMAARLICNEAAFEQLRKSNPLAQASTGTTISQNEAETIARRASVDPALAADALVYSKLTKYGDVLAATGGVASPTFNTDRLVWVVTVEAPLMTDGSPAVPPARVTVYTIVLDAATGKATDVCMGCNSLAPGGTPLPKKP